MATSCGPRARAGDLIDRLGSTHQFQVETAAALGRLRRLACDEKARKSEYHQFHDFIPLNRINKDSTAFRCCRGAT
jgi:hypothetical protein